MSCNNYSSNNIPVGLGYDSNNKPKGLIELNNLNISSLLASSITAPTIYASSFYHITGGTITFFGPVSATAFLGAGGTGATQLQELSDVTNPLSPTVGEILVYNGSKWEASASFPAINNIAIENLTNVNITSLANGQILTYNEGAGNWENSNPTAGGVTYLSSLSDVSVTSPTNSQVLTYSTSVNRWVNTTSPAGATQLQELTDVSSPLNPVAGNIFVYSGSQWIASATFPALANYALLTTVTDNYTPLTALSSYVLTSVNATLSSNVSNHIADSTIHFTSGSLSSVYVLTSVNATLSSNVSNHIADSTIHFTAESLTSTYVTTATNTTLSSNVSNHIADSTIHFTSGSLSSVYVLTSVNNALSTTVTNIQTSTINLSSYINANQATWTSGAFTAPLAIASGGTAASTAQAGIDNLTTASAYEIGSVLRLGTGNKSIYTSAVAVKVVPIVTTGGSLTWTNMPAASSVFNGSNSHLTVADLLYCNYGRIIARINASGAAGSKIYVGYSQTEVTSVASFSSIGTSLISVDLTTTGIKDSGWIPLVTNAKKNSTYLAVIGVDGDGVADPTFASVRLEFT